MSKSSDYGKAKTAMVIARYGADTGKGSGYTPPPKPTVKIAPRKGGVKGTVTIKW
jgi:hypothetical protein